MKFLQARNYTPGPRTRGDLRYVVIHTAETDERPSSAEGVASYFHSQPVHDPPHYYGSSAHYAIDSDSVVQCVRLADIAWAAPGANHNGVQLELAGRAGQSSAGWADVYSTHVLARAARLTAALLEQYGLPARRPTVEQMRLGFGGVIGHVDATRAFPGPGRTHTDPGAAFPWHDFLVAVRYFGAV